MITLTTPVFDLGLRGLPDAHGVPSFDTAFSWRDLILIAGGLFLLWKATGEIHQAMDESEEGGGAAKPGGASIGFGAAIVQIVLLDMVFSIDSILTAVGMTDEVPIMMAAVIIGLAAVGIRSMLRQRRPVA